MLLVSGEGLLHACISTINNLLDISISCKRRLFTDNKAAKIDSGKWLILILDAKPSLQKDLVVWILLRDNSRNTAGLKVSFKYVTNFCCPLESGRVGPQFIKPSMVRSKATYIIKPQSEFQRLHNSSDRFFNSQSLFKGIDLIPGECL